MFEKNSYFDLAIIGAGPAGLFAGISCSNPDFKVLILEKNESPAKKLLLTGSGRCNITHTGTIDDFLKKYGLNSLFLKPVFQNFFNQNLIDFFKSSGLNIIYDAEGRCFPVTFKAGDVLNILLKESRKKNIEIKYNSEVIKSEEADITGFKKSRKTNLSSAENKGFKIISKDGTGFYSEYLLIAAGGASYCNEAAENRGGYVLARNFGHTIKNPESGLARILLFDNEINCLPGTSFSNVEISLY
ncbi:MAG TPA: NAD(P)/FAD-dependent oxidoreductase, partial [bacterium]|nr:NAD(P)/FAD-dependent oxidoreductase [bacterium]